MKIDKDQHLWDQFIRLGERIGDGDLDAGEAKWMNREYAKLARTLVPEIAAAEKEKRKLKANRIDDQMAALLISKKCNCGGSLRQSRAGSIIAYCKVCNNRFSATRSKKSK